MSNGELSNSHHNSAGGGASGGKIRGPGRPSRKSNAAATCAWCDESKPPLKYIIPSPNGKKEFCSKTCIAEFRKAYSKGTCTLCNNMIIANSPNKDFCSAFCLNKYQRSQNSSSDLKPLSGKYNNNNNVNNNINIKKEPVNEQQTAPQPPPQPVSRSSPIQTGSAPPSRFQYESFQVFNWDDYLKVQLRQQNEMFESF